MFRTFSYMVVTTTALGLAGCQCCSHRPVATRTTVVPGQPIPPGTINVPPPPAPAPVGGGPSVRVIAPPPNFPAPGAAPGITPMPPGGAPVIPPPPAPLTVTPLTPQTSQLPPRLEPNWQPAEARGAAPQIAQAAVDPLLGAQPGNGAPRPLPSAPRLYPPEVQEQSTEEPPLLEDKTPPRVKERKPTSLPVGIAQFVPSVLQVAGVSAGLRPKIDDGLDWLAAHGYKTVLHLRTPDEADGADRTQVEKLGMTYVGLEIAPATLNRETFEKFTKIVGDVDRQRLFVYDQDGSLAGALWYLYYRKVSGLDADAAQVRAQGVGLRIDRDAPQYQAHYRMWLAAQKYLADNP